MMDPFFYRCEIDHSWGGFGVSNGQDHPILVSPIQRRLSFGDLIRKKKGQGTTHNI